MIQLNLSKQIGRELIGWVCSIIAIIIGSYGLSQLNALPQTNEALRVHSLDTIDHHPISISELTVNRATVIFIPPNTIPPERWWKDNVTLSSNSKNHIIYAICRCSQKQAFQMKAALPSTIPLLMDSKDTFAREYKNLQQPIAITLSPGGTIESVALKPIEQE